MSVQVDSGRGNGCRGGRLPATSATGNRCRLIVEAHPATMGNSDRRWAYPDGVIHAWRPVLQRLIKVQLRPKTREDSLRIAIFSA
jgi:hypothetical protein